MANINHQNHEEYNLTLQAVKVGLSALYDWIQSINIIVNHQAAEGELSPDHINRMLYCMSKDLDVLWVGIEECLTGEVEGSGNTAKFYALKDKVEKEK